MAHQDSPQSDTAAGGAPLVFGPLGGFGLENVYVQFLGGGGQGIRGHYYDKSLQRMAPLALDTPYRLSDIVSPLPVGRGAPANMPSVYIEHFISGRVYISVGGPLKNLGNGYQPASANPADQNYRIRYQYFEPTFNDSGVHVNLSYIDCLALGLILTAVNSSHFRNSPLATLVSTRILTTAAANAATPPGANVVPSAQSLPPAPDFARVLPPMAYHDGKKPNPLYHGWSDYLQKILPHGSVRIAGCFAGSKAGNISPPERLTSQTYDYLATFDAGGNVTMAAQKGSGTATKLCGGIAGHGVGDHSTVTIAFEALNATNGIYGCDPAYAWSYVDAQGTPQRGTTNSITNDFFGWVVGDLLAGLNFGFPGSTVTFGGSLIRDLPSTKWWGGRMPDGTVIRPEDTPAGRGVLFQKAQPGQPSNYNTFAASIQDMVMAYGFSLQDRLGTVLMEFDRTADPDSFLMVQISNDQ